MLLDVYIVYLCDAATRLSASITVMFVSNTNKCAFGLSGADWARLGVNNLIHFSVITGFDLFDAVHVYLGTKKATSGWSITSTVSVN